MLHVRTKIHTGTHARAHAHTHTCTHTHSLHMNTLWLKCRPRGGRKTCSVTHNPFHNFFLHMNQQWEGEMAPCEARLGFSGPSLPLPLWEGNGVISI